MQLILTPELVLAAYRQGLFPMATGSGSDVIHWLCPQQRGVLPIADFHIPRRLLKTIARDTLHSENIIIRIDSAFADVVDACAAPAEKRPATWINEAIRKVFIQLHERGHAHSIEAWQDNILIGGLYGMAIGGAFFAESMFSARRDASKIVLAHLAARLWAGGFTLLDTQFINNHLRQFGAYEMDYADFKKQLDFALVQKADFMQQQKNQKEIIKLYLHRHPDRAQRVERSEKNTK